MTESKSGSKVSDGKPVSGAELLRQAKAAVPTIDAESLAATLEQAGTIVDVREGDEWRNGHIPGAVHVPRGYLEMQAEGKVPNKNAPVVIYCAGGNRSALAARTMAEMGYTDIKHLRGGYTSWKDGGFRFEMPHQWTKEQMNRYSRHFLLPEVGEAGQKKMKDGKIMVIGAGGLGSPALYYLAAAGVGHIGVIDFDAVEESNLQRQIIHSTARVGVNKAESAAATIADLNPDVEVTVWTKPLVPSNVDEILSGYDVIIDGTDNFKTRYLANAAAFRHGIPYVYGSIFRFEGYASVFAPSQGGPCYQCMYPEPPPPELAPTCSEAGVLGVLPGIIGILQANEALKILVGYGDPLIGRMLTFDAQVTEFGEFKLRPDPSCATCGVEARKALEAARANGRAAAPVEAAAQSQPEPAPAGAKPASNGAGAASTDTEKSEIEDFSVC